MPFGGVFSVLPTPFESTGDIDPENLTRVVDLFLADGVDRFAVAPAFQRRGVGCRSAVQTTKDALERVMRWTERWT